MASRMQQTRGQPGFRRVLLAGATLVWLALRGFSLTSTFVPAPSSRPVAASASDDAASVSRRQQLMAGLGAGAAAILPAAPAFAEKYVDTDLGFEAYYPPGWQKYKYPGFVFYTKDLVEPLESVGVQVVDTKRASLDEIGDVAKVAEALLKDQVPPKAPREILKTETKYDKKSGRRYDIIEYAFQWKFTDKELITLTGKQKYQLHNKALITIDPKQKKQYVLLANADETRWKYVEDQFDISMQRFRLILDA